MALLWYVVYHTLRSSKNESILFESRENREKEVTIYVLFFFTYIELSYMYQSHSIVSLIQIC